MNVPVNFHRSPIATSIVGLVLALAACASNVNTDPVNATAAESKAGIEPRTTSASGPSDPVCGKATYAEVSRVAGGNFDKVDVIDKPDLDYVECVFLDSRDLYAGLTIRFVSTAKLVATSSKWQSAAAYFKEWSRGGKNVADVGERAAWIELPAGLIVLAGDQALQLSASKSDLSAPAVRAKFETLARAVVARIH